MQHTSMRPAVIAAMLAAVAISGCAKSSEFNNDPAANTKVAKVEHLRGGFDQIVLTARAAQRLGVRTASVTRERVGRAARLVIPYAAVLYDPSGRAFTFTSPAPCVTPFR